MGVGGENAHLFYCQQNCHASDTCKKCARFALKEVTLKII